MKKIVPTSGTSLEVGVGSGRFAAAFGIKFGFDPSQAMLDIAKSRGIEVFNGVAESLPFEDDYFDFVLTVATLCFVDDCHTPTNGQCQRNYIMQEFIHCSSL